MRATITATPTAKPQMAISFEPSAGRAIGHGVMDFLTFGVWEVIGTPIEGFQGERYQATITYDRDDKVLDIHSNKT